MNRTVTGADTAAHLGSGSVPLYATPALVALMENAAVRVKEKANMQEEFLPILRLLKQNIEELIMPLEEAQLDFYKGNSKKIQNSKELIMGELTMVVLMLTNVDAEISKGELTLLNDMRHVVYGYGVPELNSNDYFDLSKKFLQIYPKQTFSLDHMPISVRILVGYDKKHGTTFGSKARSIFTQFANAIVIADKHEQVIEIMLLENFKEILNAE
jgi:hypothetical protein